MYVRRSVGDAPGSICQLCPRSVPCDDHPSPYMPYLHIWKQRSYGPDIYQGLRGWKAQGFSVVVQFERNHPPGAKARPHFSMPCGPTKVVPFYKARFQLRFVAACDGVPFQKGFKLTRYRIFGPFPSSPWSLRQA